jgi:hypothetical protein
VPKYIEALRNPAARPEVVALMRGFDPKVLPQLNLVSSYAELGALDVVYELLFSALDRNPLSWIDEWDLSFVWGPEGAAMRRDPRFAQLAERMGIVDYWKQYGFPDGCRAGQDVAIVCS